MATNRLFEKPDYHHRLPHAEHPKRHEIVAKVQQYFITTWPWSSEGAKAKYLRYDLEDCICCFSPTGADDRVEIIAIFWTLIWLLDDMLEHLTDDEATILANRICDILSNCATPSDTSVIEQMWANVGDLLRDPKYEALQDTTNALIKETSVFILAAGNKRERKRVLATDLDSYLEYRLEDVAAGMTFISVYWTEGIVVPSVIQENPQYEDAFMASQYHLSLVNDWYSFRWEVKPLLDKGLSVVEHSQTGEYCLFNALAVLMHADKMKPDQVVDEVARRLRLYEDAVLTRFEALQLSHSHSAKDLMLIGQVESAIMMTMGGNIHWSTICGRYNHL